VKTTAVCVQRYAGEKSGGGISDRTLQEIYVHKTTDAWYRSFSGQFDKESIKGRQYRQKTFVMMVARKKVSDVLQAVICMRVICLYLSAYTGYRV